MGEHTAWCTTYTQRPRRALIPQPSRQHAPLAVHPANGRARAKKGDTQWEREREPDALVAARRFRSWLKPWNQSVSVDVCVCGCADVKVYICSQQTKNCWRTNERPNAGADWLGHRRGEQKRKKIPCLRSINSSYFIIINVYFVNGVERAAMPSSFQGLDWNAGKRVDSKWFKRANTPNYTSIYCLCAFSPTNLSRMSTGFTCHGYRNNKDKH